MPRAIRQLSCDDCCEEFLKISFNAITCYVSYISLSRIMAHYCHVIYAFTCLPRVNMRQITLLRGYIHPNEQP